MRLVLVADRIPSEVQRIVEFLNESMAVTEVLALELRYYAGNGYSMHVPRVLGRSARVEQKRKQMNGGRGVWTRESFFADLQERKGKSSREDIAAQALMEKLHAAGFESRWGTGVARGSYTPADPGLSRRGPITLFSDGVINVKTTWLSDSEAARSWQKLLRDKFKEHGIPVDANDKTEQRLEPSVWTKDVDLICDIIISSRDEVLAKAPA